MWKSTEVEDPHLQLDFAVDVGMAKFNEVKIVPLIEFKDIAKGVQKIHGFN